MQRQAIILIAVAIISIIAAATLKLATSTMGGMATERRASNHLPQSQWFITEFYRIQGTPYLYVHFSDTRETSLNKIENSFNRVSLIDLESGKNVLNTSWRNRASSQFGIDRSHVTRPLTARHIQGEPRIEFQEIHAVRADNANLLQRMLLRIFPGSPYKYYWIDRRGQRARTEEMQRLRIILPESNRYLQYDRDTGNLQEYEWRNGATVMTQEWPRSQGPRSAIVFPILDRGYVSILSPGIEIFLRGDPPRYRFFGQTEVAALFPGDPRLPVGATAPFMPLMDVSRAPATLYVYTRRPNAVYEIQPDALENGDMRDIFVQVFSEPSTWIPFAEFQQGKVLYFAMVQDIQSSYVRNPEMLYYSKREAVDAEGNRYFESARNMVRIPRGDLTISRFPYDDEHLLVFRENAFWTMKYDTGELTQLFPR